MTTLVVLVLFEQLSNAIFTADIPSEFVYNNLTSITTRYLFFGTDFPALVLLIKLLVSFT